MVRTGSGLRRWPHLAALIFLAALLTFTLNTRTAAQTTNGAVIGVVTDAQTGVLPGTTLTLRNSDTGLTRTAVADTDGRFRLGGLPPGTYELRAELQGFGPVAVTNIVLNVGSEVVQDVTMQLQGVQESVSVTAQSPIVETTKVEVSG